MSSSISKDYAIYMMSKEHWLLVKVYTALLVLGLALGALLWAIHNAI